ncbi:hypothetical protein MRX96_027689 [Rhipicephalus microplus]
MSDAAWLARTCCICGPPSARLAIVEAAEGMEKKRNVNSALPFKVEHVNCVVAAGKIVWDCCAPRYRCLSIDREPDFFGGERLLHSDGRVLGMVSLRSRCCLRI